MKKAHTKQQATIAAYSRLAASTQSRRSLSGLLTLPPPSCTSNCLYRCSAAQRQTPLSHAFHR